MCVYIIKKRVYVYVCVGGCLDKYISAAIWPLGPLNKNS